MCHTSISPSYIHPKHPSPTTSPSQRQYVSCDIYFHSISHLFSFPPKDAYTTKERRVQRCARNGACKRRTTTPPLMLYAERKWVSKSTTHTTTCLPCHRINTLPYLFLTSPPFNLLFLPHCSRSTTYKAIGGTAFNTLAISFGAICALCRLLTWLPLRNRWSPSASFQLSVSSMRKTYFLPSASRTEARSMCRFLVGCLPVYFTH